MCRLRALVLEYEQIEGRRPPRCWAGGGGGRGPGDPPRRGPTLNPSAVKVAPSPSRLSTRKAPVHQFAQPPVMASRGRLPPYLRVIELFALAEGLENAGRPRPERADAGIPAIGGRGGCGRADRRRRGVDAIDIDPDSPGWVNLIACQ